MKRSKALSLILMGSITLGGTGCGSDKVEEQFVTFTSLQECVKSGLFEERECRDMATDALAQTPRFSTKEECEQKFGSGACEGPADAAALAEGPADAAALAEAPAGAGAATQASSNGTVQRGSGSMWMPMMMGFMAGRFMGAGGPMQGSQGLYGQPQNGPDGGRTFRTATGASVSSDSRGRVANPSPSVKQSVGHNAKPMMSRGGGASSRGGFSGGSSFGGGAS